LKDIHEISPETDIIIVSAYVINDDVQKMIEQKACKFIAKPFIIPEIEKFVKQAFEGDGNLNGGQEIYGKELMYWKRSLKRKTLEKTLNYYVTDFGLIEFMGSVIDISYGGMCLQTYCLLERGHLLRFNKGTAHKTGIVRWSNQVADNNYMAGIDFVDKAVDNV
jgi:CheY-like chemotaxis protein